MYAFEKKLEELRKEHNVAGMSVAVTDREKVIWAKGFGVESVERPAVEATENSLYRIASVTKMFTGATILRLVEQGILELDKPIVSYIPWLQLSRPEAVEQMTLRHLLSHTSGLPKAFFPDGPRDEIRLEQVLRETLPTLTLKTLPNEKAYVYSNWGIVLSSCVASTATGRLYSELAGDLILKPLGMDRSTFDIGVLATYPLSVPHIVGKDGNLQVEHRLRVNATSIATGGLYSNAVDMCKFCRFLLNKGKNDAGEQVLGEKYMDIMFTKHADRDEPGDSYGLTLHMHRYGDKILYGHNGNVPPYAASVFNDPESGYGIVTLMNTNCRELRFPIPQLILDELCQ